jgi:hypothetical protein
MVNSPYGGYKASARYQLANGDLNGELNRAPAVKNGLSPIKKPSMNKPGWQTCVLRQIPKKAGDENQPN